MEHFEQVVHLVGAEPDAVFDYISDVRTMKDWIDAVVSNDPVGEPGVGQEFTSLSSFMGLKPDFPGATDPGARTTTRGA